MALHFLKKLESTMKLFLVLFFFSMPSVIAANLRGKRTLTGITNQLLVLNLARNCSLFQISTSLSYNKLEIESGSHIFGNVCLGEKGEMDLEGDISSISGTVFHEAEAKFNSNEINLEEGFVEVTLEAEKNSVMVTSDALSYHCTDDNTFTEYKPQNGEIIRVSGTTVMCFANDVEFKYGEFPIIGNGTLVMNIEGNLIFDKAKVKVGDRKLSSHTINVIFNVVGNGHVSLAGDCIDGACTTEVHGAILAKEKVEVSGSTIVGWLFSTGEIDVKDNSTIASNPTLIAREAYEAIKQDNFPSPTASPAAKGTSEFWQKEEAPSPVVCTNSFLQIEGCSILQASNSLKHSKVEIRDDVAVVYGDVCVGNKGKLLMKNSKGVMEEYVTGAVHLQSGAIVNLEDAERRTNFLVDQNDESIQAKTNIAHSKSLEFSMECTKENTIKEWKSKSSSLHADGRLVICVEGDVEFSRGLFTITGTGPLIMNIGKQLNINDATIKADSGMTADNILFNVRNTGDDVKIQRESVVDGTILGINRKIEVIESRVNGQIISTNDIKVTHASMIVCDNKNAPSGSFPIRVVPPHA